MEETLDIQRDHELLINAAMRLLSPGGTLYFSTNLRSFKLASGISEEYTVCDISEDTIDVDFKRNKRIHQCFTIRN
jgi:23S rRNA (guanine2445-N2)-methyltransferase / 23S rRNA (guanine2069-N7)-methyltransferase